jgi:hypothetical protein
MDEDDMGFVEELKLAINNALWMHCPPGITIGQAEVASLAALKVIITNHKLSG